MKNILILFLVFTLLCPVRCGTAASGIVTYVRGNVKLIRKGSDSQIPVSVDSKIMKNDVLVTGPHGRVRIVFFDDAIQASVMISRNTVKNVNDYFTKKGEAGNVKIAQEIIRIFTETEKDHDTTAGVKSGTAVRNVEENFESKSRESYTEKVIHGEEELSTEDFSKKEMDVSQEESIDSLHMHQKMQSHRLARTPVKLKDKKDASKNLIKRPEKKKSFKYLIQSVNRSKPAGSKKQSFDIIYPRHKILFHLKKYILRPEHKGKSRALILDSKGKVLYGTDFSSSNRKINYPLAPGNYKIVVYLQKEKQQVENSIDFKIPAREEQKKIMNKLEEIDRQYSTEKGDPTVFMMKGMLLLANGYNIEAAFEFQNYIQRQEKSRIGKRFLYKALQASGIKSSRLENSGQ